MSFDFAAVLRDKTMLALYAIGSGNHDVVTQEIINSIDPGDKQITREKGNKRYYVIHDNGGLNFIVGTDLYVSSHEAFTFLQNLQRKFVLQYSRQWKTAHIYQMQQEFSPQIKSMMDNKSTQKIDQIKENLEETSIHMTHAFEQALLRESTLGELEDKSTKLHNGVLEFDRNAGILRRKMCFEHYRYYFIGGFIIFCVLLLVIIISCGGFSFKYCKSSKK